MQHYASSKLFPYHAKWIVFLIAEPTQILLSPVLTFMNRLILHKTPINQSINESINQSINQSIYQSINQNPDIFFELRWLFTQRVYEPTSQYGDLNIL